MAKPTLKDIAKFMEAWAPLHTQAKWDNCGIQIGDPAAEINSIKVALDVDLPLLTDLEKNPADLVVTHHPIFFKGLKTLDYASDMGQILQSFIKNNRHLYTAHTNLDAAAGGVNDCLIKAYDMDPDAGEVVQDGIGKWFSLDQSVYIEDIEKKYPAKRVGDLTQREATKVAFCGGSGKSLLPILRELGVTLFVTGELGYHDEIYCQMNGMTALLLGHKESEVFVLPEIVRRLSEAFVGCEVK